MLALLVPYALALVLPLSPPANLRLGRVHTIVASESPTPNGARLQDADADASATRDGSESTIEAQIRAARERSYAQGRSGCCGKAADHLGRTRPPPGSPWARDSKS